MEDNFWVADSSGKPSVSNKRKRRVGKRKLEFIEWGSRPLIEFLEAIGEDSKKKHSRPEVAAFINKYINDKGLASAQKKKKVICDERLYALFGKKSVSRIKVHELLEEHFAEYHGDSSSDELLDSSDEELQREKRSSSSKSMPMKKVPKAPQSIFAALIPENIKLVYLKKSLILELLKVPESFESKIVGSFVRMKSDPNDIYQKNPFQLQLVTGVEKVSGADDARTEVCLRVSNFFKEVPISMLSDDNFNEEEMEDVRDRIKAGLLKRLTVDELQLKAQMLHVDITKHSIAKEISLLQKKINHANEKGWRREMFEYIDRRKMLQTPSEVEKLLHKIPEVIAEELEPEAVATDQPEKAEGSGCSPTSILTGNSNPSSTDGSGSGDIVTPPQVFFNDGHALKIRDGSMDRVVLANTPNGLEDAYQPSKQEEEMVDQPADIQQGTAFTDVAYDGSSRKSEVLNFGKEDPQKRAERPMVVIDLSDDESVDGDPDNEDQSAGEELDPDSVIWHYLDPQGQTRGPFSLYSLKRWSDANYFHSGFRVWRSGQTFADGVLLVDIIHQAFPF